MTLFQRNRFLNQFLRANNLIQPGSFSNNLPNPTLNCQTVSKIFPVLAKVETFTQIARGAAQIVIRLLWTNLVKVQRAAVAVEGRVVSRQHLRCLALCEASVE
jgi:hypothetical protein